MSYLVTIMAPQNFRTSMIDIFWSKDDANSFVVVLVNGPCIRCQSPPDNGCGFIPVDLITMCFIVTVGFI